MRIGDLLLERRKLRQSELTRVLAEQSTIDRRLCSLLIARGLIDFDDGARALGEQKGVPCALAKHLTNRDPELAKLLPAELGRASCALPIGKTNGGALIVCVRDPAPQLLSALQQATRTDVLMLIAPATRLTNLIATVYGTSPIDEFDVDMSSALNLRPADRPPPPPIADVDILDPDSVRLALTDLDDDRVAKDPSQSGKMSAMPAMGRTTTFSGRTALPPVAPSLESTKIALDRASSRDAATDVAMAHVAGRWVSGLVVAVRASTAIGYRGHGVQTRSAIEEISMPLALPSTIQKAAESKRLSDQMPAGPAQEQLLRLLGTPRGIAAVPVLVAGQVMAVIAVGDSIHGVGDTEAATTELGRLAQLLGDAYLRIRGS